MVPSPARCGDHPRVCGEHAYVSIIPSMKGGSSPRMRGAHLGGQLGASVHRIIPAYAGSTGIYAVPWP